MKIIKKEKRIINGEKQIIYYYENGAKRTVTKCKKQQSIEDKLKSMEDTVRKMKIWTLTI